MWIDIQGLHDQINDDLPTRCSCGSKFSVEHALSCPKGGFPTIRHNEIRDLTATLLTEVCKNVCTEPTLQPVPEGHLSGACANRQPGARLDVVASGVWGGPFERKFFDVKVFNPHAPSNKTPDPQSTYKKHERIKKRAYEERVLQFEQATFTPIILATKGSVHFLYETSSNASSQVGRPVQPSTMLAPMQVGVFTVTIIYSSHQGSPFLVRTSDKRWPANRPYKV